MSFEQETSKNHAGFTLIAERAPVATTTPTTDFMPLPEGGEINVICDNLSVRMRSLGIVGPFGFRCYVEAYASTHTLRYAIVVNENTPYACAYVVSGPRVDDVSVALNALKEMARWHIRHQFALLDYACLGGMSASLQRMILLQELRLTLKSVGPLSDTTVQNVAAHLSLFKSDVEAKLEAADADVEAGNYGGEWHHLTSADIGDKNYGISYVDHAPFEFKLGVPPGIYVLLGISELPPENSEDEARTYFTLLHWHQPGVWSSAPFENEHVDARPENRPLVVLQALAQEIGGRWQPTLAEAHELLIPLHHV